MLRQLVTLVRIDDMNKGFIGTDKVRFVVGKGTAREDIQR